MKRWFAGWMAVLILFSGGGALAEKSPNQGAAEIQESMVSREGEELGSLAENIVFIVKALQDEEVKSLLSRDDIREIFNEVIWKVLAWMFENRPVTMKILAELGVGETEQYCIGAIWDSVDRMIAAADEYSRTEDGMMLAQEFENLLNDPVLQEAGNSFFRMVLSEDIVREMQELVDYVSAGIANRIESDGKLTQQALERQMNLTTVSGQMVSRIIEMIENSEWTDEYIPRLAKDDNLWIFLLHLANEGSTVIPVAAEEFRRLLEDPVVVEFIRNTQQELIKAGDQLFVYYEETQSGDPEDTDVQSEEAAP